MPLSKELQAFIDTQRARLAIEDQEIARIPRLDGFPDGTTIESLHNGMTWPAINDKLAVAGLSLPERQIIHDALKCVSELEYPAGTFHHPTIENIREMTDQELLLLSHAGADMIDSHTIAVLRALIGGKKEAGEVK